MTETSGTALGTTTATGTTATTTTTGTQTIPQPTPISLTFGQKAVGMTINSLESVESLSCRQGYADRIDKLNDLRNLSISGEQKRLLSVAITETQGACLWSIKAMYWVD